MFNFHLFFLGFYATFFVFFYLLIKKNKKDNDEFLVRLKRLNDDAIKEWRDFAEEQRRLPGDEWKAGNHG